MIISEIINNVIAGGLLGSLGQGVRIAVGLKKFNENNAVSAAQGMPVEEFSTSRLVISIFIGFVAGAIGMLVKGASLGDKGEYNTEAIVTIIAIGYSGADFIEGVFNTYINKFKPAVTVEKPLVETPVKPFADGQQVLVPDEANFSSTPAQG
jgi:hypothetical protein